MLSGKDKFLSIGNRNPSCLNTTKIFYLCADEISLPPYYYMLFREWVLKLLQKYLGIGTIRVSFHRRSWSFSDLAIEVGFLKKQIILGDNILVLISENSSS